MKMGRVIAAGIVITIVEIVIAMVTCGYLFNWVYELKPTNVWKPMGEICFGSYYLGVLVLNIAFASFYALFNKGIPGQNCWIKGLVFGLCIWVLGMLPGMLSTTTYMTVANTVVIYWTIWSFIVIPLKGLITAGIYRE